MRFLADDWLYDVSTDYTGKSVVIALAETIIERALLGMRVARGSHASIQSDRNA
jgi:hypothetical protein